MEKPLAEVAEANALTLLYSGNGRDGTHTKIPDETVGKELALEAMISKDAMPETEPTPRSRACRNGDLLGQRRN